MEVKLAANDEIYYNPLVSIIIPVFNGSNFLKFAIESALSQTYSNIEVIVVNDGSNDLGETERIALSFGKRIRYYYKTNGGVSSALNYGLSVMKGQWFSWLSHDDLYEKSKISKTIKIINKYYNSLDISKTIFSCSSKLINEEGKKIIKIKKNKSGVFSGEEMYKNLLKGKMLNGCSLLIPKDAFIKLGGFDTRFRYIQDFVCWLNLAKHNYSFVIFGDQLVSSRIHKSQDSSRLQSIQPIEMDIYLSEQLTSLAKQDNSFYLKSILFFLLTRINNSLLKRRYKDRVFSDNSVSFYEKTIYGAYVLKGKCIYLLKKIYRKIIRGFKN